MGIHLSGKISSGGSKVASIHREVGAWILRARSRFRQAYALPAQCRFRYSFLPDGSPIAAVGTAAVASTDTISVDRNQIKPPAGEFMPVVELAGVTKAYESKVAVSNLSLSIEAGQMFGLLGPNGAGKTSSIRMMMGITMPDSGPHRSLRKAIRPQEPGSRRLSARRTRPLQEDEGSRSACLLWPAARRGR